MATNPRAVVLSRPNGAGKSTAASALLNDMFGPIEFVNADEIARELTDLDRGARNIHAGRLMLARLEELAARSADFAFETTLASRSFAPWLARLKRERSYHVTVVYLWLPSAEHAIARVRERVARGGHDIPENVVRRRYHAGLRNFFELYTPFADEWSLLNGSLSFPEPVAFAEQGGRLTIVDPTIWTAIQDQARD